MYLEVFIKKTVTVGFGLLLGIFVHSNAPAQTAVSIDGDWVGGSDLFQSPVFVHLRLKAAKTGTTGVANIQLWRVFNRALTTVNVTSSKLHFEFPSTTGVSYVADGELKDDIIQGTIRRGDQQGKFHLVRVAKVSRKLYDNYVGAYRFPNTEQPGKTVLLLVTYGALGHLRYVNLETGDTTALYPVADDKFFFAGAVVGSPTPNAVTWSFERDKKGAVARSVVRVKGRPDQIGERTALYKQERVFIRSGSARLAATLVAPSSKGKHPAVVFVPGSNALSRDESAPFREFDALISNGIAILIYDKRGVGESTGDWMQESFNELAGDALAGVAYLKNRSEINAKKIGLWGFSQGGWIAPLAASRSRDVAFVIMASGGGVTNEEAELGDQIARMMRQKLTDAEIKEASDVIRLQFQAAYSPDGWTRFQKAIADAQNKRWLPRTWARIPKDDPWWKWWALNGRYDPEPILKKVKVPVLVLFGGGDELVPPGQVPKITARIEEVLKDAGNRDVTTRIFDGANHDLSIKLENGQWTAPPQYHQNLSSWILQRTR